MTGSESGQRCDFCGLPVLGELEGTGGREGVRGVETHRGDPAGVATASEPMYCCFGCRFAAQVSRGSGARGALNWMLARIGLGVFFTIQVTICTMVLWRRELFGDTEQGLLAQSLDGMLQWLALLFAVPVWLLLGQSLWVDGFAQLRRGRPSTEVLYLSGILAAYLYSSVSVLRGTGALYLEVACVLLVLLTLGRWFEARARLQATAVLDSLQQLLPRTALRFENGIEQTVAAELVQPGDRLRTLPGERFVTDAVLVSPRSLVDEQILTGECLPVEKVAGEMVFGGTVNLAGDVVTQATAPVAAGTLSRIVESVARGRRLRGPRERLAERLTLWFTPAAISSAVLTTLGHTVVSGLEAGLLAGLAVLLMACPCALGLATPLAIWVAQGRAAMCQVLFRSGEAVERLADVTTVVFDKTGTLTTGRPRFRHLHTSPDLDADICLHWGARLARSTNHPLAEALLREHVERTGTMPDLLDGVVTFPGRGTATAASHIAGSLAASPSAPSRFASAEWAMGSESWLRERLPGSAWNRSWIERLSESDGPVVWLARGDNLVARCDFAEELRVGVVEVCDTLRRQGFSLRMLSGDRAASVARLAASLGLEAEAELTPEAKLQRIVELRRAGRVAFVGDGLNDAPALSAADVGVALASGADVTRAAGDVCLLADRIDRLPFALALSRDVVRRVRWNLTWAFLYNGVGIVCALCGVLNPVVAAALMTGSSLFVIWNSLRPGAAVGGSPTGPSRQTVGDSPRTSSHNDVDERIPRGTPAGRGNRTGSTTADNHESEASARVHSTLSRAQE